MEKLLNGVECLICSTQQGIDIVILLKVSEKNCHTQDKFPWGIYPPQLQELNDTNKLALTILDWYKSKNFALLGQLHVDVYWYPRTRKTRPEKTHLAFQILDFRPVRAQWGIRSTFQYCQKNIIPHKGMEGEYRGEVLRVAYKRTSTGSSQWRCSETEQEGL